MDELKRHVLIQEAFTRAETREELSRTAKTIWQFTGISIAELRPVYEKICRDKGWEIEPELEEGERANGNGQDQ